MPRDNKKKRSAEDMAEEELELLFASRYKEGSDWAAEQHEQAREDVGMYSGHQWHEDDEDWGRRTQFPTLTLNQIWSMVNAVSSSEIVNRFEPKYLPRGPEDQDLADSTTQIARYIRQQAGAEFVDSGAFRDALITGIGVADWYYDETVGSEGQLLTGRIPVEQVIWDPAARKQNLEDSRWVIRGTWMDVSEFEALFPGESLPPAGEGETPGMAMWGRSGNVGAPNSDVTRYYGPGSGSFYIPEKRSVLVFEMQDWITETEWRVLDSATGEVTILDDEQFKRYQKIRSEADDGASGVPAGTPRRKRVYRRSIFAGHRLMKQEEIPAQSFTIKFLTCFEDAQEEGMRWFGLVRPLRDPQRVANRGFSQVVHILATNPKGVLLHEGDVFENPQEAEIQWARPNGRIETTQGALQDNRIQVMKGDYPDDFERITQFCLNAVPRIAAIDPYFMGSGGGDMRRVSGTALSQVLQQGQMMLSIPFDGLRKFRIDQGDLLMDLMPVFLPEKSTIRVMGDTATPGPSFIEFMRGDLEDKEFDIVVGEVPVSPTAQREAWTALTESGALKSLLDMQLLDGEDIADLAADWPEDVRRRVREKAQQRAQMMQAAAAQGVPPEQAGPAGPQGGDIPPTIQ